MALVQKLADIFTGKNATAINQPWPPDGHGARISNYLTNQSIFDGDHVNALNDHEDKDRYGVYIVCNVGGLMVKSIADLLFGEEFTLEYPEGAADKDIERIAEIMRRNEFQTLCFENALDGMPSGDAVFTTRKEDNKAVIESAQVTTWVPDLDPDNIRNVRSHMFGWKRTVMDGKKKTDYLRQVIHEKGKITNKLWLMKGERLVREVSLNVLYENPPPVTEPTGIDDDFLVVHVPNFRPAREYFGRGEYKGLEGLFSALNARISQEDFILTYHADPILELPVDQFDSKVAKTGRINKRDLDVIPKSADGYGANYITYDGRLTDAKEFIDGLIDKILLISETARQLVGINDGGVAESGRALKYRLMRTLAKVGRKRRYYDSAIPKILELAQRLEGVSEPLTPKVVWPDGLPQDVQELIETETAKQDAGLTTRKRSIMVVDGLDETEAEARVEEIDAEDEAGQAAVQTAAVGKKTPINVNVGDLSDA
jgi:hypothetical protein